MRGGCGMGVGSNEAWGMSNCFDLVVVLGIEQGVIRGSKRAANRR